MDYLSLANAPKQNLPLSGRLDYDVRINRMRFDNNHLFLFGDVHVGLHFAARQLPRTHGPALDRVLRLSNDECEQLFAELFPQGWAADVVTRELAPQGWQQSPLLLVFHPTPEQIHESTVRMHENVQQLARDRKEDVDDDNQSDKPPPTLEKIRAEHQPTPIQPEKEIQELVGRCLWDIFSDNHEVTGPDGRIVDIGSFRGAGSFLAEMANVSDRARTRCRRETGNGAI